MGNITAVNGLPILRGSIHDRVSKPVESKFCKMDELGVHYPWAIWNSPVADKLKYAPHTTSHPESISRNQNSLQKSMGKSNDLYLE